MTFDQINGLTYQVLKDLRLRARKFPAKVQERTTVYIRVLLLTGVIFSTYIKNKLSTNLLYFLQLLS